jgi:hypothetical protein
MYDKVNLKHSFIQGKQISSIPLRGASNIALLGLSKPPAMPVVMT